ncbi:MAG: PKD domain-containing protein [Planctomycetota bacterium]
MYRRAATFCLLLLAMASATVAADEVNSPTAGAPAPAIEPLVRVVDLALGESQEVTLCDGSRATVKLLKLDEIRDPIRNAIRRATMEVEVNGEKIELVSANYELPKTIAGVQIDCPITGGYMSNSHRDAWGLEKDARLRLWPAGSPLVRPGTFVYPIRQRWFASSTQMANEPCYVNACETPSAKQIYYHNGLDFGGAEGLVEVVSATDGLVVASDTDILPGYEQSPVRPRADVVYVLDGRGWYYRYSHLYKIDEAIRPGARVAMGQRIGLLGKEGGSGGWSHLHFDITSVQPSGKWGTQEGYAFVWEAYHRERQPKLVAVARPHHVAFAGETVRLDGSRSWSAAGKPTSYRWTFTDGTTAEGAVMDRTYDKPGYYSEVLEVSDAQGRKDYDFAVVHVLDRARPEPVPPAIHVVHNPSLGLRPGDEIAFKVRTFGTTEGHETWDFGDGSPAQTTQSDGCVKTHNPDGYAILTHRYANPGIYLVRVERSDAEGRTAFGHVAVHVGKP